MTLMEYLIKTGSERVSQQCKENMYAVQTLKDFQYVDRDGKDQGVNVREKAKQLVALLRDEDRLREERAHALKTKEKLAQTATASSAAVGSGPPPEAQQAWPQSSGEEELQLQLALAMSKEEADQVRALQRERGWLLFCHLVLMPRSPHCPSTCSPSPCPCPVSLLLLHLYRGWRRLSWSPQAGAERSILASTAVGGFDTEPDEFSDFDRLRATLPTSGSSTGELELLAGEVPARSPGAGDRSGVGDSLAEAVGSPPPAAPPPPVKGAGKVEGMAEVAATPQIRGCRSPGALVLRRGSVGLVAVCLAEQFT
ncbi:epsin-1 isoform X1 [Cricetulus griseus]|uniref:epsin-1 isoform X1 n=1 Tax=Cricetulus griseus TaxID=10029 RepID=UPI000F7415F1|nr:epsin-1 isoform X1 [Cricetulus griseus]